jgi:hypothetical protein
VIRQLGGMGQRVELRPQAGIPVARRRLGMSNALVLGWLLFALALGIGILIGWAIWG